MFRHLGRAMIVVGLAVFYGSLLSSLLGTNPPEMVLFLGAVVATLGCLWLAGLLMWLSGDKGRGVLEATLAFLCLPAALFSAFGAAEERETPWIILAVFFLSGVVALIVQAAQVKRRTEAWRNRGQDEG